MDAAGIIRADLYGGAESMMFAARHPERVRTLLLLAPALRNVPTLLFWGTEDRAVSLESGNVLKKCFDRAEMVVLPGAGHLPFEVENPGYD